MPTIARLFGMLISMRWSEHEQPHFHAWHSGKEVQVFIKTGEIRGDFPEGKKKKLLAWTTLREKELLAAWNKCRKHQDPGWIAP